LVPREALLQILAIILRHNADPQLATVEELLGGLTLPD
jgi:hypothetical protein